MSLAELSRHQRVPQQHYRLLIIGSGVQALACAYYCLRQHNIRSLAVVAPQHLGAGLHSWNNFPALSLTAEQRQPLYQRSLQLSAQLPASTAATAGEGSALLAHSSPELARLRRWYLHNQWQGRSVQWCDPEAWRVQHLQLSSPGLLAACQLPDANGYGYEALLAAYARALASYELDIAEHCPPLAYRPRAGEQPLQLLLGGDWVSADAVACCPETEAEALLAVLGLQLPLMLGAWRCHQSPARRGWLPCSLYSLDARAWLQQGPDGVVHLALPAQSSDAALATLAAALPQLHNLALCPASTELQASSPDDLPLVAIDAVPGVSVSLGWQTCADLLPASAELYAHSVVYQRCHPLLTAFDWQRYSGASRRPLGCYPNLLL